MKPKDHPAYEYATEDCGDYRVALALAVVGTLLVCREEDMLVAYRRDRAYAGAIYPGGDVSPGFQQDLIEGLVTREEIDQVRALHSLICL